MQDGHLLLQQPRLLGHANLLREELCELRDAERVEGAPSPLALLQRQPRLAHLPQFVRVHPELGARGIHLRQRLWYEATAHRSYRRSYRVPSYPLGRLRREAAA